MRKAYKHSFPLPSPVFFRWALARAFASGRSGAFGRRKKSAARRSGSRLYSLSPPSPFVIIDSMKLCAAVLCGSSSYRRSDRRTNDGKSNFAEYGVRGCQNIGYRCQEVLVPKREEFIFSSPLSAASSRRSARRLRGRREVREHRPNELTVIRLISARSRADNDNYSSPIRLS